MVPVIVQALPADSGLVRRTVRELGGRPGRSLPIVDGFAASVPAASVAALRAAPGVRAVTPDSRMRPMDAATGESTSSAPKSVYRAVVGADRMASAGYTGQGVTVALVDTGVTPVADLAGRMVAVNDDNRPPAGCENLSGETDCSDSYGHGTFIAGLIAGSGAASGGTYAGVAPGARILSVKVAGSDGSADVSQVLAAIQWVVSYKDRYGVKVLNLSLGTDSTQSYKVDPLNYAVEKAWAAGITVVVAAGNRGPNAATISKPADDPFVITAGAINDRMTASLGDDRIPDFSSRGPTAADGLPKPDIVAPAAHLVSLSAPDSTIAVLSPASVDGAYHQGSGTSMAAAVTSGVAALVLSAKPSTSPDRLKYALTSTAHRISAPDPARYAIGSGVIDAYATAFSAGAGTANGGLTRSTGRGDLDASRGKVLVHATDPHNTVIRGAETAQLLAFDPVAYTTGIWSPTTWQLSLWYLAPFFGVRYMGPEWEANSWHGDFGQGTEYPRTWYGEPISGSAWYGAWDAPDG